MAYSQFTLPAGRFRYGNVDSRELLNQFTRVTLWSSDLVDGMLLLTQHYGEGYASHGAVDGLTVLASGNQREAGAVASEFATLLNWVARNLGSIEIVAWVALDDETNNTPIELLVMAREAEKSRLVKLAFEPQTRDRLQDGTTFNADRLIALIEAKF